MSEVVQQTKKDVIITAANSGLICIFPRHNELVLDIDKGCVINERVISTLADNGFDIISRQMTISKSGNKHFYLRFARTFSDLERTTLQAALGSDPVKEVLSLLRIRDGNSDSAIALFESEFWASRVDKWREKGDREMRKSTVMESMENDVPY